MNKEILKPVTIGKIDMNKYLTDERKKEIEKTRNEINEHLNNCTYYKELKKKK